jgi:hypothetical protein
MFSISRAEDPISIALNHPTMLIIQHSIYYYKYFNQGGNGDSGHMGPATHIAGETGTAKRAVENLRAICDEYLKDRCEIEVIGLEKHPGLVAKKEIFAIPTLVRGLPLPARKLIGDLHTTERCWRFWIS